MYFYEILQSIMKQKNLNIPEVARLSGLPDSTIRSIISRKNKTVALEVAFKLAKGLNVSLRELNGEENIIPADISLERKRLLREVQELPEEKLCAVSAFIKYLKEADGQ
ncbi:MAG: helix-turn-helix transcriptional regulator [Lachnospiraceae bacterium]|nr:helix-turn-helix transcriptional regulator [Lachnospiraceae bacterium]